MPEQAAQPDLPNTSEELLREVEMPAHKGISNQVKTKMPSTELLDRALDDGASLS